MKLRIISFGLWQEAGVPKDASYLVDCRAIHNPYNDQDLRHLRGTDEAVASQVLSHPLAQGLIEQALDTIVYRAAVEHKQSFTMGVFCIAGRHRSVAIAEEIARRAALAGLQVVLVHRDKDTTGKLTQRR